jgi:hypothetical protein
MNKKKLLENIDNYSKLEYDWDGYQGLPVYRKVIEHSKKFIELFDNLIDGVSPASSGEILFELKTKDENFEFLLLINEDVFGWAHISKDFDLSKTVEVHGVPMNINEIKILLEKYCI